MSYYLYIHFAWQHKLSCNSLSTPQCGGKIRDLFHFMLYCRDLSNNVITHLPEKFLSRQVLLDQLWVRMLDVNLLSMCACYSTHSSRNTLFTACFSSPRLLHENNIRYITTAHFDGLGSLLILCVGLVYYFDIVFLIASVSHHIWCHLIYCIT